MARCDLYFGELKIGEGLFQSVENVEERSTLHVADVTMLDEPFELQGPFGLLVERQFYGELKPTNYARLRPGYSYDRLVLQGRFLQSIRERPDAANSKKEST